MPGFRSRVSGSFSRLQTPGNRPCARGVQASRPPRHGPCRTKFAGRVSAAVSAKRGRYHPIESDVATSAPPDRAGQPTILQPATHPEAVTRLADAAAKPSMAPPRSFASVPARPVSCRARWASRSADAAAWAAAESCVRPGSAARRDSGAWKRPAAWTPSQAGSGCCSAASSGWNWAARKWVLPSRRWRSSPAPSLRRCISCRSPLMSVVHASHPRPASPNLVGMATTFRAPLHRAGRDRKSLHFSGKGAAEPLRCGQALKRVPGASRSCK